MSTEAVGRGSAYLGGVQGYVKEALADEPPSVEGFIRFCHERSGEDWPRLYDVMCVAAARGAFRGMAYEQLSEMGISFALTDLGGLAALSRRIVQEGLSAEPA